MNTTITSIFPNARPDLDVPTSVNALYKMRLRGFWVAHRAWVWGGIALLVGGALVAAFGSPAAGGVMAAVAIIAAIIVLVVQHGRASEAFWDAYAAARGFTHTKKGAMSGVPLFSKGDKREWKHVLTGNVGGHEAQLAHYTYTEVSHDSDGSRSETDYDYTVVGFRLPPAVAARYVGVYLSPKSLSLGTIQDKLAHDRGVKLESNDFHKRYNLRVIDEQDDIALYELFSPPFIDALANQYTAYWQQVGSTLVIYQKSHEKEAADLDELCGRALRVMTRYCEEYQ